MADSSKISVRLTSEIQALLSDHVRHGRRVSDIIRTALEGYLGVRPTEGPTERPTALQLSDAVSDMSDKLTRLACRTYVFA
jgi:Arc/MetJ-type ribon-helix-helix transcriptional regulator